MTEGPGPSREFVRLVRSALTHLYDYAYLENHPLAGLVDASGGLDRVTRAQRLRRLLLGCIEEVQPANTGEAAAEADRIHAILTYRYVDGLPMPGVAARRGLSQRQAYRALEAGVRAVAGLMYDHLRPAQGAADSLASGGPDSSSDALQLAQAEVEHLREGAHSEPLDLREVLTVALCLIEPLCEQSNVRIDLVTPPPWPAVLAHRVMLRQALLNLLSHAVDRVAGGELAVEVGEGQRDAVVTFVGRARAGVPTAVPGGAAPDPVGLGVAEALLAAQGGRLVTGVAEGRWSAQLYLPLASSPTLLVIDDNPDLVALLQRYLAAHRVRVVGATSAEQGLRLAADLRPCVITLDVMMPEQDGWDVLQRLRQDPATRDIPVVICSILREARLALAMGASAYITKPVTQAALLEVLGRWLGPLQAAE